MDKIADKCQDLLTTLDKQAADPMSDAAAAVPNPYAKAGLAGLSALWSAAKGMAGSGAELLGATLPATLNNAKYVALGLPVAIGGAGGYIHSRLTSPSPTSKELIQKKLVLEELRQALAEGERRRASELAKTEEDENDRANSSAKREIHV